MEKNLTTAKELRNIVNSLENKFGDIASAHGGVEFQKEALFALQILQGNSFLTTIALGNKNSLMSAVLNVAAIGLSLNPAQKLAYLVPRDGKVCLDISYIGMVKLATDPGSVMWVQAEVVRAKDTFTYTGVGKLPDHQMQPFGDRGEVVGVYSVVRLATGEYLTTTMSIEECYAIRERSQAYKKKKSGPWVTDEGEMLKKTVIKRASKLWPKTDRLQEAISVVNEHEGINFQNEQIDNVEVKRIESVDYKRQRDLIDQITYIVNEKTEDLEIAEKAGFLEEKLGIASIKDLKKKTITELELIIGELEE